ncbi:MAG: hypothetical protein HN919_01385 [Verrucomicrobia bacterium]|jgi:hypothetical protein|nr:hypothetical protein [Verrucomicrobiota bacterium]MBT7064930.1 hypothetical protein [Verrucomicrobiota bacterium]MBT7699899.1 hypothetical protein [Verrucomicrobiota bacterium]
MKILRIGLLLSLMLVLSSCTMFRGWLPKPPVVAPEPIPEPEPEPPDVVVVPLAAGDVRITLVAGADVPMLQISDKGVCVGEVGAGSPLQWDRPSGVVHLMAESPSNGVAAVRCLGVLAPGEREVLLRRGADGTVEFASAKTVRLSEVRKIARLRQRAQRLPRETALRFLTARLFVAPPPGAVRRGYADAEQAIITPAEGPVLRWTRYEAAAGAARHADGKDGRLQRTIHRHALAEFVDADIKLGVTVRVALRRHVRDIEPAYAFFRMAGDGDLAAKLESLLVSLMACGPPR